MTDRRPSQLKHQRNLGIAKRGFDIVSSLVGLTLLTPVFAMVAVLILVLDERPVFFRQWRIGLHGTGFWLYKFRTMRHLQHAERGEFDAGDASRVTRVGRLLRKTKLDELPQLWNVLRGDMSVVGPRPEVKKWVAEYPERWAVAQQVRPGITDPACVVYRNEEELLRDCRDPEEAYRQEILPHKLGLYEKYVSTRSFWGDVGIILQSLWAVTRHHGRGC